MLKKTITYTDFNGDEAKEDHFFHLSQAELVELEMSKEGGFAETMQKVIADKEGGTIIAEFKKIILNAYGVKSQDGKRFIKNQQLRDEFESSEAYSTLFMELVTDAEAAAEFVNGILPTDLANKAAKLAEASGNEVADTFPHSGLTTGSETITRKELEELPREDFVEVTERIARGELRVVSGSM